MKRARAAAIFLATFTVLHGFASASTYLWSLKRAMEISYRGVTHSWLDSVLAFTSNVLLAPLVALAFHLRFDVLRGVGAYLVVLANSFLWALVAWWILKRFRSRQESERG